MANKIIKITLEDDGSINIYNNEELKKKIDLNITEITGEDIFNSLEVEYDDVFSIEKIQIEKEGDKRYKLYVMIYDLYKNIIDNMKTRTEQYEFDVSVEEIAPISEL